MKKITITSEMNTGHKFTDVFYIDSMPTLDLIHDLIDGKTTKRGFKGYEDIERITIDIR